ncbi:MAG: hypothetical protein ABRQ35_01315 [Smithellaceae bacterium]
MDFKKIIDQVKDKAEARIKETRDSLDKDHDGIPDAVQGLSEKAKTLAAQAEEKARELAEQAEAKLDKVKADAEKVVDSARERLKSAGKDDKKA